jgi:hypothetical protein
MRRYISLLLLIGLAFWSCEEATHGTGNEFLTEDCAGVIGGDNICGCTDSTATNFDSTATFDDESCEYDTTPPTVSIQSPITSQTVNGIVTIVVETNDNEGINRVEFYIDNSLSFTDTESPYEYDWNTAQYEDFSEHIVKVISYDNSDNFTASQPILLIVDNRVYLWGEYYSIENTTELNLSGLTGSIPPEIGNLTQLTYLDLSGNGLTGSIPSEIGNLINLTYLDLDGNVLTGSIPPEIGNLTQLTYLSIRGWDSNNLTGSIPSEIGNLTNLTYLNLYHNQLTGEIPESICDLNNVSYWTDDSYGVYEIHSNFCHNQLCPPYPSCIEDYVGEQYTSDCP